MQIGMTAAVDPSRLRSRSVMKNVFVMIAISILSSGGCFAQGREAVPIPFQDQMSPYATFPVLKTAGAKHGDYFGGNVVVDGAGIPPLETVVVITCSGKERLHLTTDAKGLFAVEAHLDAITHMPLDTPSSFAGCEVAASAPGYQSNVLKIQQSSVGDSPDIGTLHLRRTEESSPVFFSATSNAAPKDAIKAYKSALAESRADLQIKDFQKAVEIYPQYAQAWYALGSLQQAGNIEEARKSYAQAAAADTAFVLPYIQLASIASQQQKWQQAADHSQHVIDLCPKDCPMGWYLNSVANYYLGKFDVAEKSARQGLAVDALHSVPPLEQSIAVILTHNQKFPEAADHLRNYLKWAPNSPEAGTVRAQLAQVEQIIAEINKQ